MASGLLMCRINRPDIWLHRPAQITSEVPLPKRGRPHMAQSRCRAFDSFRTSYLLTSRFLPARSGLYRVPDLRAAQAK